MKLELLVKRIANNSEGGYCVGQLLYRTSDNGPWTHFCDTLEDYDRGLDQSMTPEYIKSVKDVNKDGSTNDAITAIPSGCYRLKWSYSPKYKRSMPLIENVPGFSGIRIHSGNISSHTAGCLLLGENKVKGKVLNSKMWCDKFDQEFKQYKTASITYIRTYKC